MLWQMICIVFQKKTDTWSDQKQDNTRRIMKIFEYQNIVALHTYNTMSNNETRNKYPPILTLHSDHDELFSGSDGVSALAWVISPVLELQVVNNERAVVVGESDLPLRLDQIIILVPFDLGFGKSSDRTRQLHLVSLHHVTRTAQLLGIDHWWTCNTPMSL